MMSSRRSLFALAFAALAASSIGFASAADLKEVRIGFQKAGIQPAVKERGVLEAALKEKGLSVRWVEFAFGPPLLEALNTGNIDFGYTGDTPPIFAQAAAANLLYVAALPGSGKNEGIVVPANSPIKSVADLKGKRLAIPKGSSAHNTAVAILEKAGLQFTDVTAVYLPPADGTAAFAGGTVDAWAIWDPYLALAEKSGARVLSFAGDAHDSIGFFLANREFTNAHGDVVALINQTFAKEAQWANAHHDEITKSLAASTGVDPAVVSVLVGRSVFEITPVTEKYIAEQQQTADRFHKLGLIPKPINVRDIVWKWSPAS
ncbi:aliphatic sulfonate ABC transporter substrate-binding protein [Rhodopseudomonas palustris]|uniref:aliphatic sulfonate ABC transporter substrate-binding protein n=1 Tax=Rhodopseudomonas palustris TaxID=1076 RepID=UPI0021F25383|nr:aliphatic sulfonate ABC transporter substrate-binding protein [Rhodopseudomonas palustris]UYO56150.1 aliphatic sulfonate ABC transporter substrate-binding protein [Rhodopseudomonas palustris]